MPKPQRALLVTVYIKNVGISTLCVKYGISTSTLYRRLFRARSILRSSLTRQGYDEHWFADNFGDLDLATESRLKTTN